MRSNKNKVMFQPLQLQRKLNTQNAPQGLTNQANEKNDKCITRHNEQIQLLTFKAAFNRWSLCKALLQQLGKGRACKQPPGFLQLEDFMFLALFSLQCILLC